MKQKSNNRSIITCFCCKGKKYQINADKLKVICPACEGIGELIIPELKPKCEYSPFHVKWDNAGGLIC